MRARVTLDDKLVRQAQDYSGLTDLSALLTAALKALIHFEASCRLARASGTMPNLKPIKRTRSRKP